MSLSKAKGSKRLLLNGMQRTCQPGKANINKN